MAYAKELHREDQQFYIEHGRQVWAGLQTIGGKPKAPPPFAPIESSEWTSSRLSPRCIVENYLYADVATLNAPGGVGKTTLLLFEAIHIVLERPLYGRRIMTPGPVAILTAEDSRELLIARLARIAAAMDLTEQELSIVRQNVLIHYVGGENFRLIRIDNDTVVLSPELEWMLAALAAVKPVLVVIDPAVSFGVGETRVNDNEQGLVRAARAIRDRLDCCTRYVHHTGKANAREGTRDQYSGRGGSALPDGSRMNAVMQPLSSEQWAQETGHSLQPGESGIVLALPKISYTERQDPIYIKRDGFRFETVEVAITEKRDQLTDSQVLEVQEMVRARCREGASPRENVQAKEWIGHLVAEVLGMDTGPGFAKASCTPDQIAARQRAGRIVAGLMRAGALLHAKEYDSSKGVDRPVIQAPKAANNHVSHLT